MSSMEEFEAYCYAYRAKHGRTIAVRMMEEFVNDTCTTEEEAAAWTIMQLQLLRRMQATFFNFILSNVVHR